MGPLGSAADCIYNSVGALGSFLFPFFAVENTLCLPGFYRLP